MGNQQSFQQHMDFKDIQTNYTYEKKYSDSRFGEIKLLRENSTGQKIFQKDLSTNTPKEFEDYVRVINDSSALAHPNILRVYGYNSKKEDLFCADFFKLSLFFESFESDLETEIAKRTHNKDYFKETELWYILDSVASACAYLQNNKVQHKDIRPFNIFISANQDYKITGTTLFNQGYNPGYLGHFDDLEARSRYYSPELLRHFSTPEGKRQTFDSYKADVFSLGMTVLEAGLLEKVEGVYNFDKLEVKEAPIREALNRLGQRYSPNFVKTVESALDFNPTTRLDFIRLDRELSVYRRDIREQARGTTASPVKQAPHERHDSPLRGSPSPAAHHKTAPGQTPVHGVGEAPVYLADDLDHRVREAVRRSEEVIKRSSPSKHKNKDLDPYIQSYLRNELRPSNQPVLAQISPFLTSESKYTTTLTIEQPNYGRESQPINFNQPPREEIEHVVRSGFVEPTQTYVAPPQTYVAPTQTYVAPTQTYVAAPQTFTPTVTYHTVSPQPQPNVVYQTVSFGQPHEQQPTYVTHSGVSPSYATVNYGTGSHYGNYQPTSPAVVTPHNVGGQDDLTKRIEESLRQSKQLA